MKDINIETIPNDVVVAINTVADYCRSIQGDKYNPFKCRKCPLYGRNTDKRATAVSGEYEDCFFSMYHNSVRRWENILKGKHPISGHSAFEVMTSSISPDDKVPEDRGSFQIKDKPTE